MALSQVLVDYDLTTKEVRRIIVPEDDSQLHHHAHVQPGWGRASFVVGHLQVDPTTAEINGRSSLHLAAKAVHAATGVWPPNVSK